MATEDEKWEHYKNSPQEIKDLYSSKLANALNAELQEKYGIPSKVSANYLDITGDVILGYRKIAELPFLLQTQVGLSQEAARQLTSELIDAWEPVVLREEAEAKNTKESVASLADKIAAIKPTATLTTEPTTSTAETVSPAEFEPVKPMRTKLDDIDDKKPVHGYGALQTNPTESAEDEPVVKATSFEDLRLKP